MLNEDIQSAETRSFLVRKDIALLLVHTQEARMCVSKLQELWGTYMMKVKTTFVWIGSHVTLFFQETFKVFYNFWMPNRIFFLTITIYISEVSNYLVGILVSHMITIILSLSKYTSCIWCEYVLRLSLVWRLYSSHVTIVLPNRKSLGNALSQRWYVKILCVYCHFQVFIFLWYVWAVQKETLVLSL